MHLIITLPPLLKHKQLSQVSLRHLPQYQQFVNPSNRCMLDHMKKNLVYNTSISLVSVLNDGGKGWRGEGDPPESSLSPCYS